MSQPLTDDRLWPNPVQELLLETIASPAPVATAAFHRWCETIDLRDEFDRGSFRLIPMAYHRMQSLGVSEPLMGRLKGVYRKAWYETNGVLHATAPVVKLLADRGFDTLLLKGVPLVLSYYGKAALRPMSDIDIVVRPERARDAISLLESAGWRRGPSARDEDLVFRHSMQFIGPDGHELDIHWHCLFEACNADADAYFWNTARPLEFAGVTTRQLAPGSMLLHGIIHGLRWNPEPPLRWIPDALIVLNAEPGAIDWACMLDFAKAQRLTHRLGLGLDYLVRHHAAPVPDKVSRALSATRVSLTERIENSVILHDTSRLFENPITKQWVIFADYCRAARDRRPFAFIVGFSHYLRYRWRLRGRRELLTEAARGTYRRVFRTRAA